MPISQVACLGLSHHTAPIALREQFTCALSDLNGLLAAHRTRLVDSEFGVSELVVLSTCNRMEVYAVVDEPDQARELMVGMLALLQGSAPEAFADHLYYHAGERAAEHLFRVAAGLDSLVLGEPQILGQVTDAFQAASEEHTAGPVLRALFRAAIRAGKRARTETDIGTNPASISSVAVATAQSVFPDLARRRILVIGLGEMGQLALKALQARGIHRIDVANRTCTRAETAVSAGGGQAYDLDHLADALAAADVVISATGAPHMILDVSMVQQTVQRRSRELVLLDIAMPRDIDPAVADLDGVRLYAIDDLQDSLDAARAMRQRAVPRVEAILAQERAALAVKMRQLRVRPLIADLRQKAEAIRQRELERTLRFLDDVDPETLAHIQHLSRSLVNKLLHEPTIRLKEQASYENGRSHTYAETTRYLFGLETNTEG